MWSNNKRQNYCEKYRNFTWFPDMEILWKGTVSAYFRAKRLNNISNQERNVLKDVQKDTSKTCYIMDKRWRFVVLDSDDDIEKIDCHLERSSFQQLGYNPSDEFCIKVIWISKWKQNKVLDNSWYRFIEASNENPGKIYGLIKTRKIGIPVRVITSGCGTAIGNLSIFVEKCFYSEVLNIESRVKDTSEVLTTIDNLSKSNTLTSDCRLVSFDIINMFSSIDNIHGLKAVKSVLGTRQDQFQPTSCIIEALRLCLNVTILFLITNILYRVTVQHEVLICHVFIAILASNILMLKL